MTFYIVTLPSIDTRYTAQWFDFVERYKAEAGREDIVLLGDRRHYAIAPTEFLDFREYSLYAFAQLSELMKLVENGDTVFFLDGETAGAEALDYVRKMEGINVEIRSYWHAGTYDKNDLTAMRGVRGEHFERGLFDITDKIFVGGEWHKQVIHEARGVPLDKITVTGSAMDLSAFADGHKTRKTRKFIFAGRKVWEKGYDVVERLRADGVDITVSLDEDWSKAQYYDELTRTEMLINPCGRRRSVCPRWRH